MGKIWTIIKWEFLQRVKDRLFVITLIAAPLLVLMVGTAAGLLSEASLDYTKVIGFRIDNPKYFNSIDNRLNQLILDDGQPAFIGVLLGEDKEYSQNSVDCLVRITEIENQFIIELNYGYTLSPLELNKIEDAIKTGLTENYIKKQNSEILLPKFDFQQLLKNQSTSTIDEFNKLFFAGFAFLFLLIIVIIYSGSSFTRALAEEKNTHINEILLSSVSPNEILFGKYFGLALLGILQTLFWFGFSYMFFGGNSTHLEIVTNLPLLIIYFFLGYLLYSAIFLALGAQVTTENEAQQITTLTSLFLIIPVVISAQIFVSPDSLLSSIFTYFPLTTAPVMLMKINVSDTSVSEIILTIIIQIISITVVIMIASKYFAKGLSQFNKKVRR
ncbi:MAG: ABC transporter permease [Ignavibacteriales bacterium]|jgi:ABC-2 type transport system permease protein|nr:MAG: ABC transporter permease [Ignavibacteriales bacterium]